ncbi:MAG: hypothetical protein J0H71_17985 [Rhizobiales bacterium]|nr:hypothetical protein [Hyphomicrobiales bacterium]
MSKIPVAQPVAEETEYLFDHYESDQWVEALNWARKGDFAPLVECLRLNLVAPPDPMAVRNFLADVLEGKFKKPRNSKAKRDSEHVQFKDANGRRFFIDKRHVKQATAIKRVREVQTTRRVKQAKAIEIVAAELQLDEMKIAEYLRNPRPEWGLSRPTVDEMFGSIQGKSKV